jgi:Sec-independent protein secretion pathway component TatC
VTVRRNDFIVQRMVTLEIFAPVLAAIFLAVVAIPSSIVSTSTFDGYSSMVALFLQGITQGLLPPGWKFIVISPDELLQVYLVASLFLTLMLASPMISFTVFNHVVPRGVNRRRLTVCSWTAFASVLLAAGALSGYYIFAKLYLASTTPFFTFMSAPPTIDAAGFYFLALKVIAMAAVSFTLPVYVAALVYFRRLGPN